jgi:hypothetical protein
VLRREAGAELEQRLSVALHELIKDRSACGIGQCLEDVSHDPDNRQVTAYLSTEGGLPGDQARTLLDRDGSTFSCGRTGALDSTKPCATSNPASTPNCAPTRHPDFMIDEPLTDAELDAIEARVLAASNAPWQSFVEGSDHTSGDNFIRVGGLDDDEPDLYVSATPGPQASPIKTSSLTHVRTYRGC